MGCKSSMCTDASELILSQHLAGKLSDVTAVVSEKSTNLSINSVQKKEIEKSHDPVRKLLILKSVVKIALKELPNIMDLIKLADVWVQEILKVMDESSMIPEDLKTSVSYDSSGTSLVIKNELDSLRSFDLIHSFVQKAKLITNVKFDHENYLENSKFLLGLCPLTLIFYLKLGSEVDFGFGIEKPIDRKQLNQFLMNSKDSVGVNNWVSRSLQPIAVSLHCSVLSKNRFISFYLFDGLKAQNFDKGIELFEEFGAPLEDSVVENLRKINAADEVHCGIEFDDKAVKRIALQILCAQVGEDAVMKIDPGCNFYKWSTFTSLVPGKFLAIELNPGGFVLKTISML